MSITQAGNLPVISKQVFCSLIDVVNTRFNRFVSDYITTIKKHRRASLNRELTNHQQGRKKADDEGWSKKLWQSAMTMTNTARGAEALLSKKIKNRTNSLIRFRN